MCECNGLAFHSWCIPTLFWAFLVYAPDPQWPWPGWSAWIIISHTDWWSPGFIWMLNMFLKKWQFLPLNTPFFLQYLIFSSKGSTLSRVSFFAAISLEFPSTNVYYNLIFEHILSQTITCFRNRIVWWVGLLFYSVWIDWLAKVGVPKLIWRLEGNPADAGDERQHWLQKWGHVNLSLYVQSVMKRMLRLMFTLPLTSISGNSGGKGRCNIR